MDRKRIVAVVFACVMCSGILCCLSVFGLRAKADQQDNSMDTQSVNMYQVSYAEADGNNGYYRTKPEVTITNQDAEAVTKYVFTTESKGVKTGTLSGEGTTITILPSEFDEGGQSLEVWMEQPIEAVLDILWMEVADSRNKITYVIDTMTPDISMTVLEGFDTWYSNDVDITVGLTDGNAASGLDNTRYYVNGNLVYDMNLSEEGSLRDYQFHIPISDSSVGGNGIPVVVEVTDIAGNVNRMQRLVYIDREGPTTAIEGAADYLITGKALNLSMIVTEENILESAKAYVKYTDVDGKVSESEIVEWANNDAIQSRTIQIEKDGNYEVTLSASDIVGHRSSRTIHMTLDSTNPIVRYVEQLNGQYMQYFQWNYKVEDMISDFTTFEYHMNVDGYLYQPSEKIVKEGVHRFEVDVTDAAGNQTKTQASFVVDHTEPEILFHEAREGGTYEENVNLTISLANQEDTIRNIDINGQRQEISSESQIYQFPFQTPGKYEVWVTAEDLAGNISEKSIQFQVIEKTTVAAKITVPIRKAFEKIGFETGKGPRAVAEKAKTETHTAICILIAFILLAVIAGIIWYLIVCVRGREFGHKKIPHKREDAK